MHKFWWQGNFSGDEIRFKHIFLYCQTFLLDVRGQVKTSVISTLRRPIKQQFCICWFFTKICIIIIINNERHVTIFLLNDSYDIEISPFYDPTSPFACERYRKGSRYLKKLYDSSPQKGMEGKGRGREGARVIAPAPKNKKNNPKSFYCRHNIQMFDQWQNTAKLGRLLRGH